MSCVKVLLELTDEEFKAEAKRRGYNLIKIPEKVKLLPCVCGRKRITEWYHQGHKIFYACPDCDLHSDWATTRLQAKLNWNKLVEEQANERNNS